MGRNASSFRVSFELIISKFHFSHELFRPFPATIQLLGLASSLSLIGSSVVIIQGAFVFVAAVAVTVTSVSHDPTVLPVAGSKICNGKSRYFVSRYLLPVVCMNAEARSSLEVVIVGL